jgi:hypothetical protein
MRILQACQHPMLKMLTKQSRAAKTTPFLQEFPGQWGRDKAKKLCSSSASNSSACLEVLPKMQSDRQIYEQRVEEATSVAESAIACRGERKLAIQKENLRVQQMMQDKTTDADLATVVRAERKLAIQEEQLCVQQRILAIQEDQQENLVMSMDLDKMTPWVREFYMSKQKELAAKRVMRDSSTSTS